MALCGVSGCPSPVLPSIAMPRLTYSCWLCREGLDVSLSTLVPLSSCPLPTVWTLSLLLPWEQELRLLSPHPAGPRSAGREAALEITSR